MSNSHFNNMDPAEFEKYLIGRQPFTDHPAKCSRHFSNIKPSTDDVFEHRRKVYDASQPDASQPDAVKYMPQDENDN